MPPNTRFAPSPTGLLHVGNARTALVAWLFVRSRGGRFVLRLDDTDSERSTADFATAIERDLAWLGLDWDAYERQSDRTADYADGIERLKASGHLYPCYETTEDLNLKRRTLLARGRPPIYDRAALALTAADRQRLEAAGRRPHWRFKLDHAPIDWQDAVRGPVHFNGADLSDPVVIREDGRPLYHLCSVIDDVGLGITHVVRGEDHVTNTAWHVQMFQALGAEPPTFAHLPLLADAEGKGLSKRLGSLSLAALREEDGLEPMAVAAVLARVGTSLPVEPLTSLAPLVESFDFGHFARATPKLDPAEFVRINAKLLHAIPFDDVAERVAALGVDGMDRAFWDAVHPNIERLGDLVDWWQVAKGPITPLVEEPDYLAEAARLLPAEPWDADTWKGWTAALKAATGRKGKPLFLPLRQALTGRSAGPEMAALLPLIGRARAHARLCGEPA